MKRWVPVTDDMMQARDAARRDAAGRVDTLGAIAALLDGREWSADTLEQIAALVRAAGYTE